MRNTTLAGAEISDRRRHANRPHAAPAQAHRDLRLEVEVPHSAPPLHDVAHRRNRIDAKAEQRIADAAPQRLQIGEAVRKLASIDAHRRRTGLEYRLPEN